MNFNCAAATSPHDLGPLLTVPLRQDFAELGGRAYGLLEQLLEGYEVRQFSFERPRLMLRQRYQPMPPNLLQGFWHNHHYRLVTEAYQEAERVGYGIRAVVTVEVTRNSRLRCPTKYSCASLQG